jgi:hypothetical protein
MPGVYTINPRRGRNLIGLSVNTWLIIINLFAFILFTIFLIYNKNNIDYIAIKPANILAGNYLWTFATSMFMHGGAFHLFANMLSLFFLGSLIEKILGRKRYFWFYISSGLLAGVFFVLTSIIFDSNLNTFAVGASGALFGLVGLLILLTPDLPVFIMFIPIPVKMKYAGVGMLIGLWLISYIGNIPIGNTAHLGGLIAGLAYGIYLRKKFPNKTGALRKYFS